jgi:ApaG protein
MPYARNLHSPVSIFNPLALSLNSMQSGHSDITTLGVQVQVASQYLPDQSLPERKRFVFAYRVVITNLGDEPATLRSRKWIITDAEGLVEIIEGPGVIGEEPRLMPGDSHEYMSGCPLRTKWGTMEGHFVMERDQGDTFKAVVGRFFLAENVAPIRSQV